MEECSEKNTGNKNQHSSTRYGGRHYLACPASKSPEDNVSGHADKCSYRGRGFKSMTEVTRHFRNQHVPYVKQCSRCCIFFLDPQGLESHETSITCTRQGIQKGLGQVRLWKELYAAAYPGKPIPESPYYHTGNPQPPPKSASPPSDALDPAPVMRSSAEVKRTSQHRQLVLQTIDILRNNISSRNFNSTTSEHQAMIGIMHDLLQLVEKTSPPTTKEMLPLAESSSAQDFAAPNGEVAMAVPDVGQDFDFTPNLETGPAAPANQVDGLEELLMFFDQYANNTANDGNSDFDFPDFGTL